MQVAPSFTVALFFVLLESSLALTVTVPGTANPWLAGAPDGSTASGDVAPNQSPVAVNVTAGDTLRFYVSGVTGYAPGTFISPDGDGGGFWELDRSAENGIAGIDNAPASALIGVFLDDTVPSPGSEPSALDYAITNGVSAAREAPSHTPGLKQPFFIGNGVGAGSVRQTFTVPVGATRLFLGTHDGSGWFNNVGQFYVNMTVNASGPNNTVSWSTPTEISAPSDVQTIGDLVIARNLVPGGANGNQEIMLNGVTFGEGRDVTYGGVGNALYELSSGYPWGGTHGSVSAPYSNLDGEYATLLNTGILRLGAVTALRNFQLTLNSLTVGDTYHIQFWVNLANVQNVHQSAAFEYRTVITTPTGTIELDPTSTNAEGGVGQWVTGTFIAHEPGITFEFTAEDDGFPMLNAFQLRKESASPQIFETELPTPGNSFTVTGGTAPYTFSITAGSLPSGMSLSSSGTLSGTPNESGNVSVTVRVTDSLNAFSEKTFTLNVDIGLPEIEVRRVQISDLGGGTRNATFEVVAGDDLALAPNDEVAGGFFPRESLSVEYRYSINSGTFTPWTEHVYYPGGYSPQITYNQGEKARAEFRAIDAAGNRSRAVAYDISATAALSLTGSGGQGVAVLGAPVNVIQEVGAQPLILFAEDFDNDANKTPDIFYVDTAGTIHYNRMKAGSLSGGTVHRFPLADGAPFQGAHGFLLPASGVSDAIRDVVLCFGNKLKIVTSTGTKAPFLRANTDLTIPGFNPYHVAVGDFNGDGFDDIVCGAYSTSNSDTRLAVFYNKAGKGSAGFDPAVIVNGGFRAFDQVAAGDLDGDGIADVVVAGTITGEAQDHFSLFTLFGTYRSTLSSPVIQSNLPGTPRCLNVADYTGHRLGQKDVLVGYINFGDTSYAPADATTSYQVFAHQGNGTYIGAPVRLIGAWSNTDDTGFDFTIGRVTRRVVPDVISTSSEPSSGSATMDSGFLPPPSSTGEYHWMNGNTNGVVGIGQSLGAARRVALADLNADGIPDVVTSVGGDQTIKVQLNQNNIGPDFPAGVSPVPVWRQPNQFTATITPGGRTSGAKEGISFQPWSFKYVVPATPALPASTVARVEYQRNGGSWTTLPGGLLARKGNTFSTTVPEVPSGLLRFRCVLSATSTVYYDGISAPSAPIRSLEVGQFVITATARPDSDPTGNVSTHDSEFMEYVLNYTNTGSQPAQNVVVAGAIPPNTTFGGNLSAGGTSGFLLSPMDPAKATAIYWNVGTVPAGGSGQLKYFVQVKSNALAMLKGRSIELKSLSATHLKAPPSNSTAFINTIASADAYGIYSAAPAPGFKPQVATGPAISTPVVPPLTLRQVVNISSSSSVLPGAEIEVDLTLENHAANIIQDVYVEDIIEPDFVVKEVRLRPSSSLTSGDFNDAWDDDPNTTGNPALLKRNGQRLLRWNIGTMPAATLTPGSSPNPSKIRMYYKIIVKDDIDVQAFVNGIVTDYTLAYGGLAAGGKLQGGGTTTARTDIMPRVNNRVAPPSSPLIAKLKFHQETVALVGNDPATAYEPTVPDLQTQLVGGELMNTVPELGLLRVKLRAVNEGDKIARRCVMTYLVPKGTTFLGYHQRNGMPDNLASNYSYYDWNGNLIPVVDWNARIKEVRRIEVNAGNIDPASALDFSFILSAFYPPNHDAPAGSTAAVRTAERAKRNAKTPTGTVVRSRALNLETDSLVHGVPGLPGQVPFIVTRPIAFNIGWTNQYSEVIDTPNVPVDVFQQADFDNVGGSDAINVEVVAELPQGAVHQTSAIYDHNGNTIGGPGVPFTEGGKRKVRFTIGTLERGIIGNPIDGFQVNPLARKSIGITARFPWPRSGLPADRRIIQDIFIKGTDSVGRPAQGTFSRSVTPDQNPNLPVQKDLGLKSAVVLSSDSSVMRFLPPEPGRLVAGKSVPMYAKNGQYMDMQFWSANSGKSALTNVVMAVQVPAGTKFIADGTSTGYQLKGDILSWTRTTLAAGHQWGVNVRVLVEYEGGFLEENSFVAAANAGAARYSAVPGKARTLSQSTNFAVAAWQWLGAVVMGFGSKSPAPADAALKAEVSSLENDGMFHSVAGGDVIALSNGLWVVPLGSGNIVAGGAGNIVAAGAGNIVAGGAGNIVAGGAGNVVAAGAGNIVAGGAGNAINVPGIGECNPANLQTAVTSIVAGGAGNILAAGGGNLIANDGASLLANDGGSFSTISALGGNIVAGGAGNIVAGGAGNIIVVGGAGFYTGGIASAFATRAGHASALSNGSFVNAGNVTSLNQSSIAGNKNAKLLANDGTSLLANDGASLIANDGSSLLANDGSSLLANEGGSLLANDGGG